MVTEGDGGYAMIRAHTRLLVVNAQAYQEEQVVFYEGDIADMFDMILKGSVKVPTPPASPGNARE